MKKGRYSDEQILREADSAPIAEVAKRHGVSDASIYAWRKRFGEMVSDDASTAPCAKHSELRWSYDLVIESCANGQQLKCLMVVDEYTRNA